LTRRRNISATEALQIFTANGGECHICALKIEGGREAWQVEHVIPLGMGGDETKDSDNLKPAHTKCHADKTKDDARHIAKAKRMQQRGAGIKRGSSFQTNRDGPLKKKLNGEVVRR